MYFSDQKNDDWVVFGCEFFLSSRWMDGVWKSRSYADALKENPINLTFSESLIVTEYNHIFEVS